MTDDVQVAKYELKIFVLVISEKGFCVRGDLCMYDHGNDPVVVESVPQYPPGMYEM